MEVPNASLASDEFLLGGNEQQVGRLYRLLSVEQYCPLVFEE